jgi:hypothetical protein
MGTDDGGEVHVKGPLQQRQLARAPRWLREAAGLRLDEAAPKLDWSTSKLGRIETAQQGVDVHGGWRSRDHAGPALPHRDTGR